MATGYILFPIAAALPPDATSGNAAPAIQRVKSSGAAPSNGPVLFFREAWFDAATDEHLFWEFQVPANYASGGTLKFVVKTKAAQTGTLVVVLKACIAAVSGSENQDSKSLPVPDTVSITLDANQAAGVVKTGSLALSATALNSMAAGDIATLMVGRDADNASDTSTGDQGLEDVIFEYTTT